MSETTTTTTKAKAPAKAPAKPTTPPPTKGKDKWLFAGYWNALIGGFVLIVQGILTFFWQINSSINFLGSSNFFLLANAAWAFWLSAVIQILLGIFVLILIWEVIQSLLKVGILIKDPMWVGIILVIIGLLTMGLGGVLVLVGGIFYLLGISK